MDQIGKLTRRGVLPLSLLLAGPFTLQMHASGQAVAPGASGYSLIYDPVRRAAVLVGGMRSDSIEVLWNWDGRRWTEIPESSLPRRRLGAAVYDSRRERLVLFGGNQGFGNLLAATWEWNGRSWQRMGDTTAGSRDHHAMAYDATRGRTVMFGGRSAATTAPAETWEWDGLRWALVATSGPIPRARTAMAFDRTRRQTVLFGGATWSNGPGDAQQFFGDTWTWDGNHWTRTSSDGPPPRYAHAVSFDDRAGVVLLYGGENATTKFEDMWQWDGKRWSEITLTGPTPGPRYFPKMVFDRARGRTVLYGGSASSMATWEWDGTRWHEIAQ